MKKTMVVMMMVVFVLLAFTALAMAEECADKSTGIKHYNMGAYDLAEACFRNYLPTNPDAEVYYYLFRIGLHRDNLQAAFEELGKAGDYYKNIAAAELRQMAIAIGPSNPGRANTLFEEYVKLMPSANKAEISEFFFRLAVDKDNNLIVSEETKADCFAFAEGFDSATAEKLEKRYHDTFVATGNNGMRKDLAAGKYSNVVTRMNALLARGAKPEEIRWASVECLSALMGDPDKGIHGDAYRVGKEATAEDERACAEIGLSKEHVDTVAPIHVRFSTEGFVDIFVNGETRRVTGVLPWGIKITKLKDGGWAYDFGVYNKNERTPFKTGTAIGDPVSISVIATDNKIRKLYDEEYNGRKNYLLWIPEDVDIINSWDRQDDAMFWLIFDETLAPIAVGVKVVEKIVKE